MYDFAFFIIDKYAFCIERYVTPCYKPIDHYDADLKSWS